MACGRDTRDGWPVPRSSSSFLFPIISTAPPGWRCFSGPGLAWAVCCETKDRFGRARAAFVAGLSGGLGAIWLTPSFLSITIRNLARVAAPGHAWSLWTLVAPLLIFASGSCFFARRGVNGWTLFIICAAMVFCVIVLRNYCLDFRVTGEPSRLRCRTIHSLTLVSPTAIPSLSSSPSTRGAPQRGLSRLIARLKVRTAAGTAGRPGFPRRIIHAQNRLKPLRC